MNEPWTTINTPENTELYDSCYELDEFDIAVDICCTVASNCEQWDYIIMFATDHMFYYLILKNVAFPRTDIQVYWTCDHVHVDHVA